MAPGFGKAPLSKCLCLVSAGASIFAAFANRPDLCGLDLHHTFTQLELWRLVTCHLVFSTPSGIFFGIMLLYTFREFERRFKTPKFAVAILVIITLSTIMQICLLALNVTKAVAPGPFAIIFGLFPFFFSEIPPMAKGGLFFIPMSDKIFTYAFGLQVMFSKYPSSCWPSLCGLLAGMLYRSQLLPFSKISLPASVKQFCARHCNCFNSAGRRRRRRGGYHQLPAADPSMPQQLFGPPPTIALVQPDPTRVQTLVGMGFDEDQARGALSRTQNNVEAAVGLLGANAGW
mmetsp:Transcript_15620/g.31656  ORF Transcript_15620/g.31656 Transcript_15620/m.31656 type:complete len:288 (-) Transcript_15620:313-1176(-)